MGLGVTSVSSVPRTASEGHWPSGWGRRDRSHSGQIRDSPGGAFRRGVGKPVGGPKGILLNHGGALHRV